MFRKNLSLVSSFLFLCISWSTIIMFVVDKDDLMWMGLGISFAVFAVLGWLLIIPMLMLTLNDQEKLGNHEIEFIKTTFLTQELADEALHELAREFHNCCSREIQPLGVSIAKLESANIIAEIQSLKVIFWEVHGLVRRLGFKTKPSIASYL